ncbi:hypothetical protein ACQR1I_13390 [Bradyrhizobium sp. HKCCYLS2038]|uniref:hypothetical protein n=1 Tax=unclassified Bradyrhizobium TaxID=2631580 RepID=UPI003EBF68AC
MQDECSLVARFLRAEIDNTTFRHVDHLRVGYELLDRYDFTTAAHIFSSTLRAIAARAGRPEAFHHTITIAFLSLIAERRLDRPTSDVEDFLDLNTDLQDKAILHNWYAPERLNSEAARSTFLLPTAGARTPTLLPSKIKPA